MIMNPVELLTSTHALLAHQVRLTIMATLASTTEPTEFIELLNTLNLTKGNLSAHTQKLEEAGLIQSDEGVCRAQAEDYLSLHRPGAPGSAELLVESRGPPQANARKCARRLRQLAQVEYALKL